MTLGIALGSGAARGSAHAGVLEVLSEAGIDCRVVAGTSAGALIGAAYAAGLDMGEIGGRLREADWGSFGTLRGRPRLGLLDSGPLHEAVEGLLGKALIEDLARDFGAVATDVLSLDRVLVRSGPVADAVRASAAVPGLFPPVEIEGRHLVDGAFVESVPVAAAFEMGADRVIAVDVGGSDGVPEVINRARVAATSAILRVNDELDREANVTITPATEGLRRWSGRDVEGLIEAGREAARLALPEISLIAGQ